jgi:acyl carrier protein
VDRLLAVAPGAVVWNEYGPTETVVGCCAHRVEDDHPREGPVPIGEPIDNVRLHVVDTDGNHIRDSEPGELYVGGAGVSPGYHRRPELTAAAFVEDPRECEGRGRLYRTGDLVQRTSGGPLVFLGRIDDQVKVNGFRVEPGEVEACLRSHPDVLDVAVVSRTRSGTDSDVLVAYVVGREADLSSSLEHVMEHVRTRLPSHMVPFLLHPVPALSLTTGGKVDKSALPWPVSGPLVETNALPEPPKSETEKRLAEIWQEVLGDGEPVGRGGDFFALGGDSILAIEATALIRKRFDIAMQPRTFFQAESLAALASALDELLSGPRHA